DNCPDATSTCTPASGSFFPVGTTLVTCIATDASGSESDPCSFEVTVNDTEPPMITCPDNITVLVIPGETGAVVNYPDPVVTDNCPGVISSCSPASGSFFPVGTTEVTCTAEDASGNIAYCTFNIEVEIVSQNILQLDLVLNHEVQVISDETIEVEAFSIQQRNENDLEGKGNVECINVQRVHDWLVFCTELQTEVAIPAACNVAVFECTESGGEISIQCEAVPNSGRITILDDVRDVPGIPGARRVPIRFTILLQIQYFCGDVLVCEFEAPACQVEEVILCYPEGSSIIAEVTEVQCLACQYQRD
ncbi:HYR domain-containing protein, partial [Halobacillus sp. A5]|uniref:HYR domain-containing protein n=1 Tax=Halobacillus sp. A5 TaxID=2880263 RepID=UPI0020A66782